MDPPPNPFRLHRCEWDFIFILSDEFLFFPFFLFSSSSFWIKIGSKCASLPIYQRGLVEFEHLAAHLGVACG
ncbi:hypothetical protein LI328DRAFT_129681 [Trichoderma asperelloides]|nr:hypothetical protein LI328DRAFT_129681 [Trichoderma asperelloides]